MSKATEEHQWLAKFAESGCEQSFRALVERYSPIVRSVARRRTGREDLADDVTQAVFIVLAKKAGSIRSTQPLSAWLYRVTRYASIDALRRQAARQRHENEASKMGTSQDQPEQHAQWQEVQEHLELAVDKLGRSERQVILMRYYENRTLNEIATHQHTSVATVHRRCERALKKMRRYLSGRRVVLPATVLGSYLSTHAVQAAPAGTAAGITTTTIASLNGTAGLTGSVGIAKGVITTMTMVNLKIAAAASLVVISSAVAVQQTTSALIKAQLAPPTDRLELAWSEEFDGDALNREHWNYRTDAKQRSVQLPENVSVENGQLVLRLKKLPSPKQGKRYAGAGAVSKQTFKYGYYEVRAKLGDGIDSDNDGTPDDGWHHAFWCLRAKTDATGGVHTTKVDRNEDTYTEIDGFEYDPEAKGVFTQHVFLYENGKTVGRLPRAGADKVQLHKFDPSQWHTYAFLWTPDQVKFYVDDKLTHTIEYDSNKYPQSEVNVWLSAISCNWNDKIPENSEARYDYFRYYRVRDTAP